MELFSLFLSRLNVDSSPRPARLVEEQEDEPPPRRAPPRPWQSVQFATRLRARAARISWDDQPLSVPRCIVLDTDRWKAYWDTTMTLLILFSAIEVPIRLSFAVEASAYSFEWWLDVFASLLFMTDVAVNMNTAFLQNGSWITSRARIVQRCA